MFAHSTRRCDQSSTRDGKLLLFTIYFKSGLEGVLRGVGFFNNIIINHDNLVEYFLINHDVLQTHIILTVVSYTDTHVNCILNYYYIITRYRQNSNSLFVIIIITKNTSFSLFLQFKSNLLITGLLMG